MNVKLTEVMEEPDETDEYKEAIAEVQEESEEEAEEESVKAEQELENESEKEESTLEEKMQEMLEAESEKSEESEKVPEQEYDQKRYGCEHIERKESEVAVVLPDYTQGVVKEPEIDPKLKRLIALEQQTHSTAATEDPIPG